MIFDIKPKNRIIELGFLILIQLFILSIIFSVFDFFQIINISKYIRLNWFFIMLVIFGIYFGYWKLYQNEKAKKIVPHLFLISLILFAVNDFFNLSYFSNFRFLFFIISIVFGSLSLLFNKEVIKENNKSNNKIGITILISIYLISRIYSIFNNTLWIDEATTYLSSYFVNLSYFPIFPSKFFYYQSLITTYYYSFFMIFTKNIFLLRSSNLILGTITIIMILTKFPLIFDYKISMIIVILFISSSLLMFYETIIRFYSFTIYTMIIYLYYLINDKITKNKKSIILSIVVILGILINRFFLFLLIFNFIYLFFLYFKKNIICKEFLFSLIITLLFFNFLFNFQTPIYANYSMWYYFDFMINNLSIIFIFNILLAPFGVK